MISKAKYISWIPDGGINFKQHRWDITRNDGLELGSIYPIGDYIPKNQPHAKFSAWIENDYKYKYFTTFKRALNWLENSKKNTIPISRLAEYINNN